MLKSLPALDEFKDEVELEPMVSGLYALYQDATLVYIGQSENIMRRLSEHRAEGLKVFNRVQFYHLDDLSSRLRSEGVLILTHLPTENKAINVGIKGGKVWEIRWRSRPCQPRRKRRS
jgi:hypothetical protein